MQDRIFELTVTLKAPHSGRDYVTNFLFYDVEDAMGYLSQEQDKLCDESLDNHYTLFSCNLTNPSELFKVTLRNEEGWTATLEIRKRPIR